MTFLFGILAALFGLLLVVVIKLSTTFFHEMGHAIPALLFTNKPVKVYIGSYGDISNTTHFDISRLKIYFKWNIFDWKIGMCQHDAKELSRWKTALIILGGPIASLIIAIPFIFYLKTIEQNSFLFFVSIIFIAAAIYDLCVNLFPFSAPIPMHDGSIAYSDGVALSKLVSQSVKPAVFFELQEKYHSKEYTTVIEQGYNCIDDGVKGRFPYDFVIAAKTAIKDYTGALETYGELKEKKKLSDGDYFEIGKLHRSNKNYPEALKYFEHFRYKNYQNTELLKELSSVYLEMGDEYKALEMIEVLLSIDKNHFDGYLLKSRVLTMREQFREAIEILDSLVEVEPDNAMIYYQYGLVYEELNRSRQALENFEKAKALNCTEHGLAFKIESAKGRL